MPKECTIKVAVVGSGLAGLTAAYLLAQPLESGGTQFEVHVFEKSPTIGMDSASVSLPIPKSNEYQRIDVPMRSFQGGYYPQLIKLYKYLDVSFRQADFSYSFSSIAPGSDDNKIKLHTSMIYNGSSGRAGVSIPSSLIQSTRRKFQASNFFVELYSTVVFLFTTLILVFCYLRMLFYSVPAWRSAKHNKLMFGEWMSATTPKGYISALLGLDTLWIEYTTKILIPLFSAVCTAPAADIVGHPAEEFLDYIWLTFGTHHYVVSNGVHDVVAQLTVGLKHIHTSSHITSIQASIDDTSLVTIECDTPSGTQVHTDFHHIIFATQANRAIPLLASYATSLPSKSNVAHVSAIEQQIHCLKAFKYCTTIVVNHTDPSLLPNNAMDRRDLNLVTHLDAKRKGSGIPPPICVDATYTMATHILNRPKNYPKLLPPVYQTTNPIIPPLDASVLSIAKLERAVLTMEAKDALKALYVEEDRRWWRGYRARSSALGPSQGAGRISNNSLPGIWICGSYAFAGIPLLEGCVGSARIVVEEGIFKCENVKPLTTPWTD
ncbi:hypothetical protein BDQ17DRAFT_1536070 [Cyathus striatus]|nr:hypothetical protein BDQ17DRAFT_1536070 [Cyathus striatus]